MLPTVEEGKPPQARFRRATTTALPPLRATRLIDQLREHVRGLHYSRRIELAYVYWSKTFIRFHDLRHPNTMGDPEIQAFLTYLAANISSGCGHVRPAGDNAACPLFAKTEHAPAKVSSWPFPRIDEPPDFLTANSRTRHTTDTHYGSEQRLYRLAAHRTPPVCRCPT